MCSPYFYWRTNCGIFICKGVPGVGTFFVWGEPAVGSSFVWVNQHWGSHLYECISCRNLICLGRKEENLQHDYPALSEQNKPTRDTQMTHYNTTTTTPIQNKHRTVETDAQNYQKLMTRHTWKRPICTRCRLWTTLCYKIANDIVIGIMWTQLIRIHRSPWTHKYCIKMTFLTASWHYKQDS